MARAFEPQIVGLQCNFTTERFRMMRIARRVRKTPDQHATMKVFPSLVIYPAFWLFQALALGFVSGWLWGLLAGLLALPAGWAAMRFLERQQYFGREARGFLLLRTSTRLAAELRERRGRLYREVAELAENYRRDARGE